MQKDAFKTLINGIQASIPTPNWESSPQDRGYIANKPFYKYQIVEEVLVEKTDSIGVQASNYFTSFPSYGDGGTFNKIYQIIDYPLEPNQLEGYKYTSYESEGEVLITSKDNLVIRNFGYQLNYFVVVNKEVDELGVPVGTYINAEFWGATAVVGSFDLSYPIQKEQVVNKFQPVPIEYIDLEGLPRGSYEENDASSLNYIFGRPCYDSRELVTVNNLNSDYTIYYDNNTYYLLKKRKYAVDDLIGMTLGINDSLFILQEDNLTYFNRENPEWISICLPNGMCNFFVANKTGEVQVYLNGEFVKLNIPMEGLYCCSSNVSKVIYQADGKLYWLDEKYLKPESTAIKYNTNFKDKVLLNLPCYEDNYIIGPNYTELIERYSVIFGGKQYYLVSDDVNPIFIEECTILESVSSKYNEDINYFLKEIKEEKVHFSSDKKSFYIPGVMVYINQSGTTTFYYNSGGSISVSSSLPGLYFCTEKVWNKVKYPKAVCFKDQTFIKKINPKFLPDNLIGN